MNNPLGSIDPFGLQDSAGARRAANDRAIDRSIEESYAESCRLRNNALGAAALGILAIAVVVGPGGAAAPLAKVLIQLWENRSTYDGEIKQLKTLVERLYKDGSQEISLISRDLRARTPFPRL